MVSEPDVPLSGAEEEEVGAASPWFGKLLRDFRQRAGVSPSQLAAYVNEDALIIHVDASLINELEAGHREPPCEPEFYERLRAVPGFTDADITLLLESIEASRFTPALEECLRSSRAMHVAAIKRRFRKKILEERARTPTQAEEATSFAPSEEPAQEPLTNSLQLSDASPSASLVSLDTMPYIGKEGESLEQHVRQFQWEAFQEEGRFRGGSTTPEEQSPGERGRKRQGIVFEGRRLPANTERQVKPLLEALVGQDHPLRKPAEQSLQRFGAAVAKEMAKDKGILIEQASQLYGMPAQSIARWVDMGLIPVVSRSKKGVYLDREAIAAAAPIYNEAKERGVQPVRLLKDRLAKQVAGNPQQ
jgi:hypothetical protein